MTQMPPAWITVFISSGILVVGSVTLLTKSIVDQKEEQVKRHKDLYNSEKEKSEEERAKFAGAINEIRGMLQDISADKLDPVSALKLRDAIKLAEQIPENLVKLSNDCKCAADWFNAHKKAWAQEACKEGVKKYSQLISFNKRKAFKVDLSNYFEWVYVCLSKGGTRTTLLTSFVDTPAISSANPYIAAIEHVVSKEQWNGLTYQQKELVQGALSRLIELIRKR